MRQQLIINNDAKWHVLRIGLEQTRVIVVDNFFENIELLRGIACTANYQKALDSYYPGVRAQCPSNIRDLIVNACLPVIAQAYNVVNTDAYDDLGSWFSLALTAESQLHPLQCIPHFDSQQPHDFAVMLYLNPAQYQGTGFYRQRGTGFENILGPRWPLFKQAKQVYEQQFGPRQPCYFDDSNEEFELLGKIDYRPNRLVIYPGTLLHSGLISANTDLNADPNHGRLTLNLFVSFTQSNSTL